MDCLLEAYGDASDSPLGSVKHNVKFYEDVLTDGESDEFSKVQEVYMSNEKALKDTKFDEALLKFYISNKVKQLKRRLTASRIDKFKKQRTESHEQTVFMRYSGKYFCSVAKSLTPHQVSVIHKYGAGCFLKFEKTDVPLRFVKWIAGKFDTRTSEIQLPSNFILVTKDIVHNILEIPIGGLEVVPDREAGRSFILSHFNVPSIPQVSYFGNKLKFEEDLSDEDILIFFMAVLFQSFLCPNSSLQPSTEYLHLFRDVASIMKYDLCKFVYDWLLSNIKKFRKATKFYAKRQITLGGNHYILAVAYLDSVDFGLKSLPEVVPRVLVWKGSKIREYVDLDKCSGNSFGKRPLKHVSYASKVQTKEPQYSQHRVSENLCSNVQTEQPSFIDKLSSLPTPFLDLKQLKTIAEVVQLNTVGNPVEFEQKCEEIFCKVLKGLYVDNQNMDPHTPTDKAVPNATSKCYEPFISSPSFKIESDDKALSNKDEIDFDFNITRDKLASGKYQELAKRLNARGNVFQAADNFDFSNSGTCYQQRTNDCSYNEVQHTFNVETVKSDANTKNVSVPILPCHIDIPDSEELAPATLQPYGHIDNYLVLVYCRKLFMDHHPRYSKKHTFFSYVGEAIYKYNEKNGDVMQTAFQGANSAYPMWRSNQAVPCYVRHKINLLTYGTNNMFIQDSDGHEYLFNLQKLPSKTCITGDGWQRFISDFRMEVGEMVLFEMSNKSNAPMRATAYDADLKFKERKYVDDTSSESSGEDLRGSR
ncbi:hypothetical protein ACQ4PT_056912 [Festuca glaucescens]